MMGSCLSKKIRIKIIDKIKERPKFDQLFKAEMGNCFKY